VLGALSKVGEWDLTEVQDLFKEMDQDGSGSVDKEEFRAFVKAASAAA
jgi:Ca2+-binding EF-hand superfamily protein